MRRPTLFVLSPTGPQRVRDTRTSRQATTCGASRARRSASKKGDSGAASSSGKFSVKGFGKPKPSGSPTSSTVATPDAANAEVLRDRACDDFYRWLRAGGASIDRVAIAMFGRGNDKMRGLMALEAISAGQTVLSVPRKLALFLSEQGSSPAPAALALLHAIGRADPKSIAPLIDMLPDLEDASTITDFFSDEELEATEWEPLVRETRLRVRGLESALANTSLEIDMQRVKWASFNVVSRAFTLRERTGDASRYLVPLIDMINHVSESRHSLAVRGDRCEVVAGADIRPGEQITFAYGGGALSNDRLLQDYGFVQRDNANDLGIFLGPTRTLESSQVVENKNRISEQVAGKLKDFSSTMEEDKALLDGGNVSGNMRNAVLFRYEMKRTLHRIQNHLNSL